MTERSQIHSAAQKHLKPYGRFLRIEHSFEGGWPDVYYLLCGKSGWIEEKLIPTSGRCPEHFTLEQLIWGEMEVASGGRWHLLSKRDDEWLLLNANQARLWYEGGTLTSTVQQRGKFPLRDILRELTK